MNSDAGFKVTIAGTLSWISSWVLSLDLGQVVGLLIAVCGIVLQLANFFRARRTEQREIEKHKAEMAVLSAQLAQAGRSIVKSQHN